MESRVFSLKNIVVYMFIVGSATLLGACGGGGGGTSYPDLSYTGIETAAVITQDNADEFPSVIIDGGSDSSNLPVGASVTTQSVNNLPDTKIIKKATSTFTGLLKNKLANSDDIVSGATITGTCGGTSTDNVTTGTNTYSLSLTFNNYCEGDLDTYGYEFEMHGKIIMSGMYYLDEFDNPVITSMNIEIVYLRMSYDDGVYSDSAEFSGNIVVTSFDAFNNPVDMTMTINYESEGKIFKFANVMIDDSTPDAVTISGTFYHPDHGYVIVTTTDPFALVVNDPFDDTDDQLCDGTMHIEGSDGAGNIAVIDYTAGISCATYDICVTINTDPEICSLGNTWGTDPVWPVL